MDIEKALDAAHANISAYVVEEKKRVTAAAERAMVDVAEMRRKCDEDIAHQQAHFNAWMQAEFNMRSMRMQEDYDLMMNGARKRVREMTERGERAYLEHMERLKRPAAEFEEIQQCGPGDDPCDEPL